jgi:hypothetical protein
MYSKLQREDSLAVLYYIEVEEKDKFPVYTFWELYDILNNSYYLASPS